MATKRTPKELAADRAELAKELATIQARIEPDLARIEDIKVELGQLGVDLYSIPGTKLKLDITQGSTFKPDLFSATYPAAKYPQFYKLVPDLDKVKAAIPENALAPFKSPNKKSVKVK